MSVAERVMKGVTYYNPQKADNGYTLFSPNGTTDTWLIDMEGHIINHWKFDRIPGEHSVLLPSGNVMRAQLVKLPDELDLPLGACGLGGELVEADWDGNVVWRAEVPYQTHDFFPMDNGNILYCDTHPEGILPDELAVRWKGGRPGAEYKGKIFGDGIVEINRDKEVVWKWRPAGHLDPEIDAICPLENRDHFHANAVWKCRDGNILFSPRSLSEVIKIEYPSGKVIGRYGRGEIYHQHDCRELANGNILIFDNGPHRPGYGAPYSRVVEIDPNTGKIVWEYKADPPHSFYSGCCSGSERLANGNTAICEAMSGRLFEVTYEGEIVWEYISPFAGLKVATKTWKMTSLLVHRAHRYPHDYPGFKGKDLDPARLLWENTLFGPDAFNTDFKPLII